MPFRKSKPQLIMHYFSKRFLSYIIISILTFIFLIIDFNAKTYLINANSICSADLMYSIKENLISITLISAIIIAASYKDFDCNFSYNRVLKFSARKQMYKSHFLYILLDSFVSSLYIVLILFCESALLTKKLYNWDYENSYYGFVCGQTYQYTFFVFLIILFVYIFCFLSSQMLIALNFRWMNLNNYYIFFVLFITVGVIMLANRFLIQPSHSNYGLNFICILPYITFLFLITVISLTVILKKIVPKKEFY